MAKKNGTINYGKLLSTIKPLKRELVDHYREYFDNDVLNSEGRKVFEQIVRICLLNNLSVKKLVDKVRRKPTYDNVLKFLNILDEMVRQLSE